MRHFALLPFFAAAACVGDSTILPDAGSDATSDVVTNDGGSDVTTTPDADAGPVRTGNFQWLYQLKGTSGLSLAVGADGSTTIATTFNGTATVEGTQLTSTIGGSDLLVLQLDAKGKVKWYKHYGATDADVYASAVGVSGNTVVVAGYFIVHDTTNLTWTPVLYNPVTADNEENPAPFFAAFDGTQNGTMTWARSVVAANGGEGRCNAVSSTSVAGELAIGCNVFGNISIPTQGAPVTASTLNADVISVIRASDGTSTDSEIIEGVNGTISVGLDPDLNAYAALDVITTPIKFLRAGTSAPFDASTTHNVVMRLKSGGGATWTNFWPSTLTSASVPRISFDSSKNPWIGFSFNGSINLGAANLVSAGATDWAVAELAPADGKVTTQKSFGAATADDVLDIGFDGEDLVLYGDGNNFPIGTLAVPSSPGSSTRLVLAKMDKASLATGAWVQTATETNINVDWSTTKMGIGGGLEVIGGAVTTEVDFTSTDTVSGSGIIPAIFVAGYAR